MPRYNCLLLFLVTILLAGCSVTGPSFAPAPLEENEQPTVSLAGQALATVTPTPFQPLPPTPTYLPTVVEAPKIDKSRRADKARDFPAPSEFPTIPIPSPANRLNQPEGEVNILVLGSDQRAGESLYRTDTILLLSLNPQKKTVNLVSFPRDLFVYIPGWTMQRINTAYAHGGYETIAMTMEYNFGVRPDHYVVIDFSSFVEFIDSLGGIDVYVEKSLSDNHDQYGWYTVQPGTNHMNGQDALWYVRSRYTTSDFDRNRRQQAVIRAVLEHLFSINVIARVPDLYKAYADNVTTDLKLKDVLALLPFAAKIRDISQVHQYFIDSTLVTEWITPGGAMVLLPNQDAVLNVIRQALNSR